MSTQPTKETSISDSIQKGIILTVIFSGVNLIIRSIKRDMAPPPTVKTVVGVTIAATTSVLAIDFGINKGWLPRSAEIPLIKVIYINKYVYTRL